MNLPKNIIHNVGKKCDICGFIATENSGCFHDGYANSVLNTKESEKEAVKHDKGKAQLSLITRESLEYEAAAFEYGAKKYGRDNYKQGMNWTRVLDAALRHLTAFNAKEDLDHESLLNHLAHAKACVAMLIYYYENKIGTDDR